MKQKGALSTLWRFIRPESEELVAYLFIIFLMIGIAAYKVAVQGDAGSDSQDIISSFQTAKDSLYGFFNQTDGWGRLFLFGFWFLIGTVTYVIAWSLITMLIDLRNDIEISASFVHPKSFHKSDYWASILSRVVLRVASGITLVFYSVFWLAAFGPVWLATIKALFSGGITSSHIIDSVSALIGIALTLHIAAILLRLTLLRAHYGYED